MDDSKSGMIGPAFLSFSVNLSGFVGIYTLLCWALLFPHLDVFFLSSSLHIQSVLPTNIYFDSFIKPVKRPAHWTQTDFQYVQWDDSFVNLQKGWGGGDEGWFVCPWFFNMKFDQSLPDGLDFSPYTGGLFRFVPTQQHREGRELFNPR